MKIIRLVQLALVLVCGSNLLSQSIEIKSVATNGQFLVEKKGKRYRCDRVSWEPTSEKEGRLRCFIGSPEKLVGSVDLFLIDLNILLSEATRIPPPILPSKVQPKRDLTQSGKFAAANLYNATGDFNGDGIDDFISPPRFGNSIVLSIGRANNTFEPDRLIAVGGDPRTVIASDLNKDGFPDFVVGHFGGISLVTATGASTYAPAKELPAGGRVESLFQADFNNDQLPDIAGILYSGKAVVVLLNTGSGNFAPPIRLTLPEDGRFLVAGDINGDARPDLILTTNEQSTRPSLMTLLNNGSGGFGAVQSSPLPDTPAYLAITDTNSDNRLDAIVRLGNGLTSMHAGNGTGLFTRRSVHGGGYGFTTGFDLLEINDSNRFLIYPGKGDYLLVADRLKVDGTLNSGAAAGFPGFAKIARVADLNGDSQPDLIAAGDGTFGRTGGLWIRLRSGQDYAPVATLGSIKPSAIEVIDINGDGRPDIVALDSGGCSALMNNGSGSFAAPIRVWDAPGSENYRLLAGDFNNDKRGDIVIVGASSMQVFVNSGNGGFRPAVSLAVPNGVLNAILGDVNGDGLTDLLAMTGTTVSVRNGRRPVLIQYLAQADGNFRAATDTLTVNASEISSVLAIVDLNNDKIPDVVYSQVPALSFDTVRIQLGIAGGGYREGTVFSGRNNMLFQDVDGDGTLDAVNNSDSGDLALYRGRGDGSFGSVFLIPGGGSIIPAQLNDDKKVDFVALVPGLESFILPLPSNFPVQNNTTVVSGASSQQIPAAPNSIVSVYGTGLATATESTQSATWSDSLVGTTAEVRGANGITYPARLAFVSPGQVNLLIPGEVYADDINNIASVQISSGAGTLSTGPVAIRRVSPSIFIAGQNLAAANLLRARGATQTVEPVVGLENGQLVPTPIDLGPEGDQLFLLLYGTGIRNRVALNQVTATIGGVSAPVSFAGNQGQFPGVDQINVQIPRNLAGRGVVDVVLRVSGINANTVRIAIR